MLLSLALIAGLFAQTTTPFWWQPTPDAPVLRVTDAFPSGKPGSKDWGARAHELAQADKPFIPGPRATENGFYESLDTTLNVPKPTVTVAALPQRTPPRAPTPTPNPYVIVPTVTPPSSMYHVHLTVSGVETVADENLFIVWSVHTNKGTTANYVEDLRVVDFDATEGEYAVTARVKEDGKKPRSVPYLVTLGKAPDPIPAPGPGPGPGPQPPPGPKPTELYLYVVTETGTSDETRASLIYNKAFYDVVAAKCKRWWCVDEDVKDPSNQPVGFLKPYTERARAKGVPMWFLTDQTGRTTEGKLGKIDDLTQAIKDVSDGKK